MGFFDSIFGNGGRGLTIEDSELGFFKSIVAKGEKVIWEGHTKFLNQEIELFMSGDKEQLNDGEKEILSENFE